MEKINPVKLKIKLELLEKFLSARELKRISVNKRLNRIRKHINSLISFNQGV